MSGRRINWRRRHWPVLAAFFGVVALLHWPLVINWRTHVVGRPFEDVFEVLWQLRWMDTAVFNLHTNPFFTPHVFHPQGWYLASGAQPSWYALAAAPFTHLLGATAVYNLSALLTFILGGFGVYLLAQQYATNRLAGFVAGCIYITMPNLTLRLGGHWHTLLAAMFLPYVVWAFHRTLTRSPVSRRWMVVTAVLWAMMILASWYFLFIGVIPVLAYVAGLLWLNRKQDRYWRSKGTAVLDIGLLCLLLISPFIWLTWQANQAMFGERIQFSADNSAKIAISPNRLLTPSPNHPFWKLTQQDPPLFPGEKDMVFIGFGACLLALVGLIGWDKRQRLPLLLLGVTALLLGLGLFLYWQGERVLVGWPFLDDFYECLGVDILPVDGRYPLPLPGLLLHRYLPFYDSIRVWARYDIAMMLAVSVLAASGASMLARNRRWGTAVVFLFLLLILWEGNIAPYNHFTEVAVNERQANEWLAAQPADTVIYEYPDYALLAIMYSQSIHQQTIVNGYMSRLPIFFREAVPALGRWPRQSAVPILQEWGVDYVIINGYQSNEVFTNEVWPAIEAIVELCLVADFDDGFMDFDRTAVFALQDPGKPCLPLP